MTTTPSIAIALGGGVNILPNDAQRAVNVEFGVFDGQAAIGVSGVQSHHDAHIAAVTLQALQSRIHEI